MDVHEERLIVKQKTQSHNHNQQDISASFSSEALSFSEPQYLQNTEAEEVSKALGEDVSTVTEEQSKNPACNLFSPSSEARFDPDKLGLDPSKQNTFARASFAKGQKVEPDSVDRYGPIRIANEGFENVKFLLGDDRAVPLSIYGALPLEET
jgi:hypothetical protein